MKLQRNHKMAFKSFEKLNIPAVTPKPGTVEEKTGLKLADTRNKREDMV